MLTHFLAAGWWGRWQRGHELSAAGHEALGLMEVLQSMGSLLGSVCVQSTGTIGNRHRNGIYKPQSSPNLLFPVRPDWE